MYPTLNETSFQNTISDPSLKTILVFISASWCGNCKKQHKQLAQITDNNSAEFNLYLIDPDESRSLVKSLKVMVVPTILIYSHGILIKKFKGVKSASTILKHLKIIGAFDVAKARANAYKSIWERLFKN